MKYLSTVLLAALVSITTLKVVGAKPEHRTLATSAAKARLQLTTSIVGERSCYPWHLGLKLRFTFKNAGNEPVIVDKRSIIGRALISRSLTAAASKKYAQIIRSDQWGLYFAVDPSDMSNFVIIKPGESYDLETGQTRVTVQVTEDKENPEDNLLPGSYFLQVEVATWTYLQDPKKFKKAWSDKGYLWYGGLLSQPMPFSVPENRPIEKCS